MPVTNTKQARIELSEKQYKAVADIFAAAGRTRVPMVALEETNIESTIVAITPRGMTMIDGQGNTWAVGGKGAVSGVSAGDA